MIHKKVNGWKVDIQPKRNGKRFRKTFKTKAEALRWEAWIKNQALKTPEWEPEKQDKRKLSELINDWYELHGKNLKDGNGRLGKLRKVCSELSDPVAAELTPTLFNNYRAAAGTTLTPNTLNHHLAYLKAVYNELIKLDNWTAPNPLQNVRKLKTDDPELTFLSADEISRLLVALENRRRPYALKVAKVCLSTGARWSEAEELTAEQVRDNRITYHRTKSGKSRTVPITTSLYKEVRTAKSGRLFEPCYDAFMNALEDAEITLPKGQKTHVLRHTFASHFVMNGGNLLTLQKILGHQSLAMTMRYAHLAPEHLQDAVEYNPLNFC